MESILEEIREGEDFAPKVGLVREHACELRLVHAEPLANRVPHSLPRGCRDEPPTTNSLAGFVRKPVRVIATFELLELVVSVLFVPTEIDNAVRFIFLDNTSSTHNRKWKHLNLKGLLMNRPTKRVMPKTSVSADTPIR